MSLATLEEKPERLWTIKELADRAGVSSDTIERELERRQIEVLKVGRKVLIPHSEAQKIFRRKKYLR